MESGKKCPETNSFFRFLELQEKAFPPNYLVKSDEESNVQDIYLSAFEQRYFMAMNNLFAEERSEGTKVSSMKRAVLKEGVINSLSDTSHFKRGKFSFVMLWLASIEECARIISTDETVNQENILNEEAYKTFLLSRKRIPREIRHTLNYIYVTFR